MHHEPISKIQKCKIARGYKENYWILLAYGYFLDITNVLPMKKLLMDLLKFIMLFFSFE